MLKHLIIAMLIVCLISATACASQKGLKRTPIQKTKSVNFESLEIKIDLPDQSDRRCDKYRIEIYDSEAFKKNTGSSALVIYFHPYWADKFGSEPEYYLVFNIVKTANSMNIYSRYKRLGEIENDRFYSQKSSIDAWVGLDEYSDRKYYFFQKQVKINDNENIFAGAKLLNRLDVNPLEKLDIEFVIRVLNSIQPLP